MGRSLRHVVEMEVGAAFDECLERLLRPDKFLAGSRYTYSVSRMDGVYEVVFRWVKWGMTRLYRVRIRVVQKGPVVKYVSLPGSDHDFYMEFHLRPSGNGRTRVRVEARMRAGLMADLLGRGDYARFVEELLSRGLGGEPSLAAGEVRGSAEPRCEDCLLYEPSNRYCYYLRSPVPEPEEPPCNGKGFVGCRV